MMVPDNLTQDVSYASSQEMNSHLSNMSIQEPPKEEYRPLNVKDALTYLDKVKAKFSSQSNVYNQFLDIMKDFKTQTIDTPGVIERVSTLFRGHPTLISGFNTFLPPGYRIECSVDAQERNIIKVTTPSGTTSITDSEALNLQSSNEPPTMNKSPVEFNHAITYVNKIKSRFASQPDTYKKFLEILQTYQKDQKPIQEVYTEVQVLFDGSNELLDEFKQFLPEPNKQRNKKRLGNIPTLSISKRTKHHHKAPDVQTSDVRSDTNNDESTQDLARPTFSAEEAEFFQKVKTYIGNKATYNAFLKVLNLFSQQIVDQNILVSRVESFIGGHAELFDWFKQLVGYEEDEDEEDNLKAPRPSNNNNYHPPPSDESVGCGPSYRRIANKAWQDRSCSGRDALCWDVLNDTYISHPTWASEDTGYVAAKKNQYEEALHRVEEERYDYDLNIEANLNAMAVLEPIAKKLSVMSPEEKANFRLSSDQLAASPSMYQRIIKKIYGPIKGLEMIDLLYSNPSQTVPIVLRRLKQKDDEWKRAQREWNKIWREVERKNFWKSLDYQGITFKINDRKNIAAKTLIARQEQGPFVMHDTSVFKDIARLLYFYLVKQPVYNPDDCLAMRLFLQHFCSAFFDVADVEPSNAEDIVMVEDAGADDDTLSIQSDNTTTTTIKANAAANAAAVAAAAARSSRRARRGRNQLNESKDGKLRKDVLTRNLNSKKKSNFSDDEEEEEEEEEDEEDEEEEEDENDATKEDDSTNVSGDDEDEDEEDDEDESDSRRRTRRRRAAAAAAAAAVSRNSKRSSQQRLPKTTKKTATVTPKLGALIDKAEKSVMEIDDENQKTYNFFGDNSFYCFFRLYQILYDRLVKMKSLDAEFRNDPEKSRRAYEEARDLGITPKRFKALKMDTKRGYYHILLSLIDKLFEGDIDQQVFEECVRYIFGAEAHIMFTIDKLVLSIVRHVHIIIADSQSQELYELFKLENRAEKMDQGDVTTYRTRVAGTIVSMENTYHITFKLKSRTLNIRLLDNATSQQIVDEGCGGYDDYVANYIDWANETKGINQLSLTPRFLKRNLTQKGDQTKKITIRSGMQYKICRDSYHMFYIIGTEDAFVRRGLNKPPPSTLTNNTKWNQWLDNHWSQGLTDQEKLQAEQEAFTLFQ